jgi:hypothetical protein
MIDVIRSKQALAFAGAGVSRPLGYPRWDTLLERFADETRTHCGEHIQDEQGRDITVTEITEMKDLLVRAEIFKWNLGARYHQLIREIFAPRDGQLNEIRDLISLPFQHFLTSNYDMALELAHDNLQQQYSSIAFEDPEATEFVNNLGIYDYARRIVHVHGRFDRPESVALTEREYGVLYNNSLVVRRFWQIVPVTRRCVFCGFSFNDVDLGSLFSLRSFNDARRQGGAVAHFALLAMDIDNGEGTSRAFYNTKYGIEPVFFKSVDENFSGYSAVIRMMAKEIVPSIPELLVTAGPTPISVAIPPAVAVPVPQEEAVAEPVLQDVIRLERLTDSNLKARATGELQ